MAAAVPSLRRPEPPTTGLAQHGHQRLASLTTNHAQCVVRLELSQLSRASQQGRCPPHGCPATGAVRAEEELSAGLTLVGDETIEEATPCELMLCSETRVLCPAHKLGGSPSENGCIRGIGPWKAAVSLHLVHPSPEASTCAANKAHSTQRQGPEDSRKPVLASLQQDALSRRDEERIVPLEKQLCPRRQHTAPVRACTRPETLGRRPK